MPSTSKCQPTESTSFVFIYHNTLSQPQAGGGWGSALLLFGSLIKASSIILSQDTRHFLTQSPSTRWVFPKIRGTPKWMVKIMLPNPMNKWMIWGYPYFWFNTHFRLMASSLPSGFSASLVSASALIDSFKD